MKRTEDIGSFQIRKSKCYRHYDFLSQHKKYGAKQEI